MDLWQVVFIYSRLILGALAVFLGIVLWSRTQDVAWMLVVIGVITAYIEIIFSILEQLGIVYDYVLTIESISLAAMLLPALLPILRLAFFIAAFLVMVIRRYRHHF